MNIVHYIMGIPPLRQGGLIRYAIDLAEEQVKQKHTVKIMYAGEIRTNIVRKNKVKIVKRKNINGVGYYEIINPLPVSVSTGMCDEQLFMQSTDPRAYKDFFIKNKIEVLHIHSLMGLHLEVIKTAKKLGIKTIYTSHDYFGICPKTDRLKENKVCLDTNWKECNVCCNNPISYKKIKRKQSHLFYYLLSCKWLVKAHTLMNSEKEKDVDCLKNKHIPTDYEKLREYYKQFFKEIDFIHYNSNLAKSQYERVIGIQQSTVFFVSHHGIKDCRKRKELLEKIHIGYLGGQGKNKGYDILYEALVELQADTEKIFELEIYFKSKIKAKFINEHAPYDMGQIDAVFSNIDILVVPSQGAETFGFVVLEAFMHGVPIVITENVGAKDFLNKYPGAGVVVKPDKNSIELALKNLLENRERILKMNRYICEQEIDVDYEKYVRKIISLYNTI